MVVSNNRLNTFKQRVFFKAWIKVDPAKQHPVGIDGKDVDAKVLHGSPWQSHCGEVQPTKRWQCQYHHWIGLREILQETMVFTIKIWGFPVIFPLNQSIDINNWLVKKNHLEKYEFVNGKDDIPYIMENKKCVKPPT